MSFARYVLTLTRSSSHREKAKVIEREKKKIHQISPIILTREKAYKGQNKKFLGKSKSETEQIVTGRFKNGYHKSKPFFLDLTPILDIFRWLKSISKVQKEGKCCRKRSKKGSTWKWEKFCLADKTLHYSFKCSFSKI